MSRITLRTLCFVALILPLLVACQGESSSTPEPAEAPALEGQALEENSAPPPPDRALEASEEEDPAAPVPSDDDLGAAPEGEEEAAAPEVDRRG